MSSSARQWVLPSTALGQSTPCGEVTPAAQGVGHLTSDRCMCRSVINIGSRYYCVDSILRELGKRQWGGHDCGWVVSRADGNHYSIIQILLGWNNSSYTSFGIRTSNPPRPPAECSNGQMERPGYPCRCCKIRSQRFATLLQRFHPFYETLA